MNARNGRTDVSPLPDPPMDDLGYQVEREAPPAPAHDLPAERAVLHGMFQSAAARDQAGRLLLPDDFYRPAHQVIYRAMIIMDAAGEPIDPITVRVYIADELGEIQALGGHQEASGYLVSLWSTTENHGGHVGHWAGRVVECATRRRAEEEITRAMQTLRGGDGSVLELLARCQDHLSAAARHAEQYDVAGEAVGLGRFLDRARATPRPWVLPGLLRAQDRVLVTSGEGVGKSTLTWQVATMAAAGVHPFTYQQVPPVRVLLLDLENNPDDMADALGHMAELGAQYGTWDAANVAVWHHPEGVNLRSPEGAYRMASVIRKAQPQLVCGGPLWKMGPVGASGWEAWSWDLTQFWDRMRRTHGCALWLETHPLAGTGKRRDLRPRGGETFQAWPEVGLALHPNPKGEPDGALRVGTFRGQRGKGRVWPVMLHRRVSGNGWPWEAKYPDGTLMDPPGQGADTYGGWR